jgi:hypothetical protein
VSAGGLHNSKQAIEPIQAAGKPAAFLLSTFFEMGISAIG